MYHSYSKRPAPTSTLLWTNLWKLAGIWLRLCPHVGGMPCGKLYSDPEGARDIPEPSDSSRKRGFFPDCGEHSILPRLDNHRIVFVDERTAVEIAVDLVTGKSRSTQ